MAEKKKVRYNPKTAADVLASQHDHVAAEAAELAEQEGVIAAAYVDYVEALKNYESRSDVETLERRRARESGTSFSDADFRRDADEQEEGLMTTETTKPAASDKNTKGADSKGDNPKK